jgi:hypothetical protein
MGLASKVMGIRPWEWTLMTVEEADYVVEWLREYKKTIDEATK